MAGCTDSKMYYVYILKSLKDNGFYIGCTKDLNQRLVEHNKGKTKSLRSRRPLVIVYTEKYDSVTLAFNREKEIKSYKGGHEFKKLLDTGGVA